MQNWQCRVHVREEEIDAFLDDLVREESRRGCEGRRTWRTMDPIDSIMDLAGERALALCLAQLADDLRSRALRPFLLWYRVVSARQLRRRTIAARIQAVAFDFPSMTRIAGSLY